MITSHTYSHESFNASSGSCSRNNLMLRTDVSGMWTGVVTTSRITHATPAPMYAASPERMWEDDSGMPAEARGRGCRDIASQLLGPTGQDLHVSFLLRDVFFD